MNVLEKAQKSLEYLKNSQNSSKKNELQSAAGTLGRCLGALGGRPNHVKHYANLLQSSVPVLLSLASNDNAEIRALGEEALDRAVVGGFAFHSFKTNLILQNEIDHTKNARWIRAALTRICLGDCWLRPGVGKIRSQAQSLIPKLSQILHENTNLQVIVEGLENNLPRILKALAEYSSDEELYDLAKALFQHVNSDQPPVRRGVAFCLAHLCLHRDTLLTQILSKIFENLWPIADNNDTVLGWFGVIKSLFQINDICILAENNLFSTQEYLELYQLCINYLEVENNHNRQNSVMECVSVLISQAKGDFKRVLLDKQHKFIDLDCREKVKAHSRNISSVSNITSVLSNLSESALDDITSHDQSELSFSGALFLGSLSQMQTPMTSVEDLTLQTPDSPQSDDEMNIAAEVTCKSLSEKLEEIEVTSQDDDVISEVQQADAILKVNIGSSSDVDIPLKYCARLLASKFLLTGNKNCQISDRIARVSVKSSALTCLSEILQHYPQAMTMFLDKDAELKCQNISGSSVYTESRDNINDFILERNVCYQDSLSDSLALELLNRSIETQSHSKKNSNETDMKSSKDVLSNILDSKEKLVISNQTDSSNQNTSLFSSNMTSNDPNSTVYPLTSSADVLSSSIDLDMKFDHFGESMTNLENSDVIKEADQKKVLKRTDPIDVVIKNDECEKCFEVFEFQHMSDVFVLLEAHTDPQIRGLVRVCIGNYLTSALDLSHGNYYRWRNYNTLTKDINNNISTDKLVDILLKGLSDEIHSCVNYTLSSLSKVFVALAHSSHANLLLNILNSLVDVQTNPYWLCKVNLCKLYEKLPYQRLYILYPGTMNRCGSILNTLYSLLSDQDPTVRSVAANTITIVTSKIYPNRKLSQTACVTNSAVELSEMFTFGPTNSSLHLVRDIYFYNDLPEHLKNRVAIRNNDNLKITIGDLFERIMETSCKFYWQGLLEALHSITLNYKPWFHISVYENCPIMEYCLDTIDYSNSPVTSKTKLLDICTALYPVEIHKIVKSNKNVFEREAEGKTRWVHLDNEKCTNLAEKFLQVTLKMLNILVHLIEEVNPNVHLNKSGIALPGSPVRRKTQDSLQRKSSTTNEANDDKNQRKKLLNANIRANLIGHFFNDPLYMKLYESLKAVYSNYKVKIDQKSSMFYAFLRSVLDALAIQLELSTEREFGFVTEELLYYLKVIMPFCAEKSVFCITQLLKCLFSTNMLNDYQDFMNIKDSDVKIKTNNCFYKDALFINDLKSKIEVNERDFLIKLENFHRNKIDRKWGTNKKELERYIRLFEPVVIQALKSYTMQNDIPLQCKVLCLLNQLLTLRVNYCMLDSDQVFIGFLLKQLDLVEQHEIPDCCELVHNILLFLVQLSSSKHHSKQIIEIPKLMQLCDGLMASGSHSECVEALKPVVVRVFWMATGSTSSLGRTQQTEAQATREVLFYMMQKTMHDPKVLDLVSCVLQLSQEHPESYYRWSELASDTLLNLLSQRSIDIESRNSVCSLEKLLDSIYIKVLLEQSRVEMILKILFKAPPDQATTSFKQKVHYLAIIMVLLRKLLTNVQENDILLSINYLKASFVSPQSLFFNVKNEIDPLNVQNFNENCANLSPDVILVRFLFKTLTFAIIEIDKCNDVDSSDLDIDSKSCHSLLYSVCINIICNVKNMLHLTTGCLYPLTAKTAQSLLHNEQSGLNTGLYSPEENIPMELLNLICLRSSHRMPLLTVHWSHLLIRLKFLEQKYWQSLLGYVRNLPLKSDNDDGMLHLNVLQIGCFMSYCEYFVENGLSEAVHLTWLLVNRMHVLIHYIDSPLVLAFVEKVQGNASASGLLLQAVATRCQTSLKDEFALNTYKLLSKCHEKQSGALIFLCCRIIGKLEPSIAVKFANLAVERSRFLIQLPVDDITEQLTKEDVQVALELLQRSKIHVRYPSLVCEINLLASSIFDLSPLDLDLNRAVNPQHIASTNVDNTWLINQIKSRCCETACVLSNKLEKHVELATLLLNLSKDGIETVLSCQEFDRNILKSCFKVSTDDYVKAFLNVQSVYENKHFESQRLKEQREMLRMNEMTVPNNDSNILNVANTLHVFKRTDSKESKSQFFIPMTDNVGDKFGKLEIAETDYEFIPPVLPDLFASSLCCLEKNLTNVIRLFPKQNRPLSQSDNFDLNKEQTIDKYTRKCHEIFQEKEFLHNFCTIHNILTGFLSSLHRIHTLLDDVDCELTDKIIDNILPTSISRQISIFTVISLQYLSFLIKNKKMVETPIHSDVSFRLSTLVQDKFIIDNIIGVTLNNCSMALSFKLIWLELNGEVNLNRTQSAISCLYVITKYFLQDTKPLKLKEYIKTQEGVPKSDVALTYNKLLTLIEYWESNFFNRNRKIDSLIMSESYRIPLEKLLVNLARLDVISHISLIPPIAWGSIETDAKKDFNKIDLPLQALQDMDVLEPFIFRVNFIGWSSKKLFEEIWVGLLGALQGNGTHWAVRGITQLLISTVPRVRRDASNAPVLMHLPRTYDDITNGMQRLRNLIVGTSAYGKIFDNINLERIPIMDGYHYAQFNTEYLKYASDITDDASFRAKMCVKRGKRNTDVDVASCLQLLMDVAMQMLHPKAQTGLAARCSLLTCIINISDLFTEIGQWCWLAQQLISLTGQEYKHLTQYSVASHNLLYGLSKCLSVLDGFDGLAELSTVHQKLLKSLSSSYAPLRQAALQGCLLQLTGRAAHISSLSHNNPYKELVTKLREVLDQYLCTNHRISLYEQTLYWTVLFTLVQLGHSELMHIAVNFLLKNHRHFCSDLVAKGITSTLRQQVLPKDLKKNIIIKLSDNMNKYDEKHAVQIFLVHLFTADNKLLSPRLSSDVSNMDPDVLMSSMERLTLLYKILKLATLRESKFVIAEALKYFLRETLPPASILSRIVIEFIECCREAESYDVTILRDKDRYIQMSALNAEIVYEVFQTALSQDQLPVVSGWLFEALSHLLQGKITEKLLPYILLCLLISASSNTLVRSLAPLSFYTLRLGFESEHSEGIFRHFFKRKLKVSYNDRRLLCVVALNSGFNKNQLVKIQELCTENCCLDDLLKCLVV